MSAESIVCLAVLAVVVPWIAIGVIMMQRSEPAPLDYPDRPSHHRRSGGGGDDGPHDPTSPTGIAGGLFG